MHGKDACFAPYKVRKAFEEMVDFKAMKSGKWSEKRFRDSANQACQTIDPTFRMKAKVKLEPLAPGKPPRLIIADGDDGQIMALLVIYHLEKLLYKHFENRSIKHVSRRKAMERIMDQVKRLGSSQAQMVEGDGSAWDTCCQSAIRNLIENPIIAYIGRISEQYFDCQSFNSSHEDANTAKKLKLAANDKLLREVITIEAIRRSGHRGTSVLNWLVNYCLWMSAVLDDPSEANNPDKIDYKSKWGHRLRQLCFFEGDDSLLATWPKLSDSQHVDVFDFWKRCGFNMKLVYGLPNGRVEFTGWHLGLDGTGYPNSYAPDLARCMRNMCVSTSDVVREAAKHDDAVGVSRVAKATALARAYDFAGFYPTVSNKFMQYYHNIGPSPYINHEIAMQIGMNGDVTDLQTRINAVCEVEGEIELLNLEVGAEEESLLMDRLGVFASGTEIDAFNGYTWGDNRDHEGFRASLPALWK
jgi:hypothetical protein